MPGDTISTEIAVSTGYTRTVEQFPDEIGPAFITAKKLRLDLTRPIDPAGEPTLIYVIANDNTDVS